MDCFTVWGMSRKAINIDGNPWAEVHDVLCDILENNRRKSP